jgi:hypothetical protein
MNVRIEITHEGQTFAGEVELVASASGEKKGSYGKSNKPTKAEPIKKPSTAVEFLYRKDFFRDPQTLRETWDRLGNEGFNFSRPAVLMALQAAEYLTMTGKRGSYRFVQKFPPTFNI